MQEVLQAILLLEENRFDELCLERWWQRFVEVMVGKVLLCRVLGRLGDIVFALIEHFFGQRHVRALFTHRHEEQLNLQDAIFHDLLDGIELFIVEDLVGD